MAPLRKMEPFLTFFCCLKCLHLCKWHQNSASRGAELWTSKQLLKRSRFGSSFFLSAVELLNYEMQKSVKKNALKYE